MQRKIALILAVLLLCASLCGCSSHNTSDESVNGGQTSSSDEKTDAAANKSTGEETSASNSSDDGEKQTSGSTADKPDVNVQVVMTVDEAVRYIKKLPPSVLGLSGTNMSAYRVYAAEEVVPVNKVSCVELFINTVNTKTKTNSLKGIYLLAKDGSALYQLDTQSRSVTPLTLPGAAEKPDAEKSAAETSGAESNHEGK